MPSPALSALMRTPAAVCTCARWCLTSAVQGYQGLADHSGWKEAEMSLKLKVTKVRQQQVTHATPYATKCFSQGLSRALWESGDTHPHPTVHNRTSWFLSSSLLLTCLSVVLCCFVLFCFSVLGFELRAYTLSHSTSPFLCWVFSR
jgi:hypothetical protein